jgi:hypothetical protein
MHSVQTACHKQFRSAVRFRAKSSGFGELLQAALGSHNWANESTKVERAIGTKGDAD